jgi:hypothetical protein
MEKVNVGVTIVILILGIGFQQSTKVLLNQNNKAVIIYNENNILILYSFTSTPP